MTKTQRIAELHGQLAGKCAEIEGLRVFSRRQARLLLRLRGPAARGGASAKDVELAEVLAFVAES